VCSLVSSGGAEEIDDEDGSGEPDSSCESDAGQEAIKMLLVLCKYRESGLIDEVEEIRVDDIVLAIL
jgi:hypothetical protein